MKKFPFAVFFVYALLTAIVTTPVEAISPPAFSSCPAPGGELLASYSEGIHGVPGDQTTYYGSDSVHKLNQSQVVQCLCPDDGAGIQTTWWNVRDLSIAEQDAVIAQGWVFVPNGALWGLDADPYLAKNTGYNCSGGIGGGFLSENSSTSVPGQVLGAFAATGDSEKIALLLVLGISLIMLSRKLAKTADTSQ